MTEYTTRYLWENVFYTSEKDAQAAAAKFATDFANDKFLAVCDVIVVEPDPKRYNAFKVDKSNRLTTHPKILLMMTQDILMFLLWKMEILIRE